MPFLSACASIAPTFLSMGNHEWVLTPKNIKDIEATGVTVLDNCYKTITVEGREICVGGLSSATYTNSPANLSPAHLTRRVFKEYEKAGPDVSWLEEFCSTPGYHILLSHHPEYHDLIPEGIELILSGHCHGGQIRLFGRGLFAPGQGLFPRYDGGVYEHGEARMVVGRGLSNTAPFPRLFNPREIVYIE